MNLRSILFLAACICFVTPAAAAAPAYDLLILACDDSKCSSTVERAVSAHPDRTAEYDRHGLKLMIEPLVRRTDEEDARVSINVRHEARPSLAQRLEGVVLQCTLKQGAFSHLTAFVRDGRTYQIWARLAAMR